MAAPRALGMEGVEGAAPDGGGGVLDKARLVACGGVNHHQQDHVVGDPLQADVGLSDAGHVDDQRSGDDGIGDPRRRLTQDCPMPATLSRAAYAAMFSPHHG